jgi:hypothetical protein
MKLIYDPTTEKLHRYPREDDAPVIGLAAGLLVMDIIELENEDHDPATQRLERLETIDIEAQTVTRGYRAVGLSAEEIADRARKKWPTVTQFWEEIPEQARQQIALSDNPNIVVLRTELAMWRGEVWADDARVVGALDLLVQLSFLTAETRDDILGA